MYRSPTITHAPPAPRHGAFRLIPACLALVLIATGAAWTKPPAGSGASAKAKPAAGASTASPRVDSARVKQLYLDGEFDAAIAILEDNLKETRPYGHGDSVFIFKHLGVMYAAQYDTREKGKYYMHRLLEVEPSAKIMDMYASDMIYMIFKNIQEEYEQTRMASATRREGSPRKNDSRDGPAVPASPPPGASAPSASRPAQASRPSGNGKKWIWAGLAAATVATGVGAYMVMNEKPAPPPVREARF